MKEKLPNNCQTCHHCHTCHDAKTKAVLWCNCRCWVPDMAITARNKRQETNPLRQQLGKEYTGRFCEVCSKPILKSSGRRAYCSEECYKKSCFRKDKRRSKPLTEKEEL